MRPWLEEDAKQTVYSDGAYQSASNRALEVNDVFTGLQGRQSRYLIDEGGDGTARITDTRTGDVYEAEMTGGVSLRIPYPKKESRHKWRYFHPKQLESMRSRKLMEDIPPEEKNKRKIRLKINTFSSSSFRRHTTKPSLKS